MSLPPRFELGPFHRVGFFSFPSSSLGTSLTKLQLGVQHAPKLVTIREAGASRDCVPKLELGNEKNDNAPQRDERDRADGTSCGVSRQPLLLTGGLRVGGRDVELAGQLLARAHAEGGLQAARGLATLLAREARGLNGGLALRRHGDFNNLGPVYEVNRSTISS